MPDKSEPGRRAEDSPRRLREPFSEIGALGGWGFELRVPSKGTIESVPKGSFKDLGFRALGWGGGFRIP